MRQYDHEVQGGTRDQAARRRRRRRPERRRRAPAAARLAARASSSPTASARATRDIDTYHMAACAIDEAVRNVVAVGGDPDQIARARQLLLAATRSQSREDPGRRSTSSPSSCAPTRRSTTITTRLRRALHLRQGQHEERLPARRIRRSPSRRRCSSRPSGEIDDVRKAVTMDAKTRGRPRLRRWATTKGELGGSEWYSLHGITSATTCRRSTPRRARRSTGRSPGDHARGSSPPATTAPTAGSAWPWPRRRSPAASAWTSIWPPLPQGDRPGRRDALLRVPEPLRRDGAARKEGGFRSGACRKHLCLRRGGACRWPLPREEPQGKCDRRGENCGSQGSMAKNLAVLVTSG